MLKLNNIYKSFGTGEARADVLKGVSLNVKKGEIVTILGASGSGKTTLLNVIGGITPKDKGDIFLEDKKINALSEKEMTKYRRDNLGYVFQRYNLISKLTVKENILMGAWKSKDKLDLNELIFLLGLSEHVNKFPRQLSGGQQQRTAIGRALIKRPKLLLCDEPTGALDYKTSKEILKLLADINKDYGSTIIIVTHNKELAKMGDLILTIKDGVIVNEERNKRVCVDDITW